MEKKKKEPINKACILFYAVAVIFLFIGAFGIYMGHEAVASYKAQGYTITFKDMVNAYVVQSASHFGMAIITYGIAEILKRLGSLNLTIASCMDQAIEKKEDADDDEDEDDDDEEFSFSDIETEKSSKK